MGRPFGRRGPTLIGDADPVNGYAPPSARPCRCCTTWPSFRRCAQCSGRWPAASHSGLAPAHPSWAWSLRGFGPCAQLACPPPRGLPQARTIGVVADQAQLHARCFHLSCIKPVDVFFVRRDTGGEGGSGLALLRAERIRLVLNVIKPGGLLVTDKFNGFLWLTRMLSGKSPRYPVDDRTLYLSSEQPWADRGLYSVTAD